MNRGLKSLSVVLAPVLMGGAAFAAEPAHPPLPVPPVPRGEVLRKVFPTPRLYRVTRTSDGKAAPDVQMCLGAEPMLKMMDAFRGHEQDLKPLGQGCTHKIERKADGSAHLEMSCDKAAGAMTTSRMVMDVDGQMKEMRQHMELVSELTGAPRTLVADTRFVQLGECPADLKPGEMRMADGTVVDPMGMFAGAAGGQAKPGAASPSPRK